MAVINVGKTDRSQAMQDKHKMAAKEIKSMDTDRKIKKDFKTGTDKAIKKVHRGCRIVFYRVIEVLVLVAVISLLAVILGNLIIPSMAYGMSSSVSLTQSTNIYVAFANWILPMLFYTILMAGAAYCGFKWFMKKLHNRITETIDKKYIDKEKD